MDFIRNMYWKNEKSWTILSREGQGSFGTQFTLCELHSLPRDGIGIPQGYSLREENSSLGDSGLLTNDYQDVVDTT